MNSEAPSSPRRPSRSHVALALLALSGLVLFILACRPSWSPDGQRVLYSYGDKESQRAAVAVFDRRSHTSRVIWVGTDDTQSDQSAVAPQWTADGEQAILTTLTDKAADVLVLPLRSQKPARRFRLEGMSSAAAVPIPQIGNHLFLGGQKGVYRLDLETGEILENKIGKNIDEDFGFVVFEFDRKIMYLSKLTAQSASAAEKEGQTSKGKSADIWELGEIDLKDLSFHATLTLSEAALNEKGIDKLTGFIDGDRKSGRIALLTAYSKDDRKTLVVLGREGIEKVLDAGMKSNVDDLGNPQWSRDGKLIYVPALLRKEGAAKTEFAVLEVPVDGKSPRIDRIEEGPKLEFNDDFLGFAQIALSPDGKLIAVSNGYNDKIRPEKKGIFLLDVSQPGRPVSFYPAPALPAVQEKPAAKTEAKPAAKE